MSKPHIYLGNKAYSSWSMRPWLALKVAGIAFDETTMEMFTPKTVAWLASNSPNKKFPALHHDGLAIAETIAIIEYVHELAPDAGLWPKDIKARAVARAVSAEMHAGFPAVRQNYGMHVRKRFPKFQVPEPAHADVAAQVGRIEALWAECRQGFGNGGPFLFGKFGAADCMFAPVVARFVTYPVALSATSQDYVNAVMAQPYVKEWIADAQTEGMEISSYEQLPDHVPFLG